MKLFTQIKLLVIVVNLPLLGYCQQDSIKKSESELIFWIENPPEYPGGLNALIEFVNSKAIFPEEFDNVNVEGKIFIKFMIDSTGLVINPKVLRGLNPKLDSIALVIVKSMPKWKPATQKGKPISIEYMLPVKFSYKKKNKITGHN
jgi:TonB family protein